MLCISYGNGSIRFCCCHCRVADGVPEWRHAPILEVCACVGIPGFLGGAPYRTMHYQCIVAHALHSFRSHDGYMWACLPRYPHSSGDSIMSRSPAPDTLSVLRITVTWHVPHNTLLFVLVVFNSYCVYSYCVYKLIRNVLLSLLFMYCVHSLCVLIGLLYLASMRQ